MKQKLIIAGAALLLALILAFAAYFGYKDGKSDRAKESKTEISK